MKKNAVVILIMVLALFGVSCKSQKKSTGTAVNVNDSLLISIQKFPCFGVCPYYEAKIFESGYVWYSGKKHTDKTGIYESKATQQQIKEIVSEAIKANYFLLPDSFYNAGIADFPVTITKVGNGKKIKTVYDGAPEAPKALNDFEKYLHDFFHTDQLKWRLISKSVGDE